MSLFAQFWSRRLSMRLIACGFLVFGLFQAINHQQSLAEWVSARVRGRVQAALTSVTLNSGNGNVVLGTDISSEATALSPDTGAYRWTVNGSNFMSLNMPFDQSASSQTDLSGTGNHASYIGGGRNPTPELNTANCKVGTCMMFDGVDDVLSIADSATMDLGNVFTIAAWINTNNSALPQYAISKWVADHTSGGYIFGVSGGGVFAQKSNGSSWDTIGTPVVISNNTWHHIAWTWDGTTTAGGYKLYVDGAVVTSAAATQASMLTNNQPLTIGNYFPTALNSWNGEIDEVQIFPRALSAAQIAQLYTDGSAAVGGPTIIQSEETTVGQLWDLTITPITSVGVIGSAIESSNPVVIVSGAPTITGTLDNPDEGSPIISALTIPGGSIAGYRWLVNGANYASLSMPFNSGATQFDISGNASHGTVSGATFTTSGCKVGNCLSFDGNDYVTQTLPITIKTSQITFSSWVKQTTTTGAQTLIAGEPRGANAIAKGVYTYLSGGVAVVSKGSGTGSWIQEAGTSVLAAGTWNHIVGTVDDSELRIYVNGVLEGTTLNGLAIDWTDAGAGNYPDPAQLYLGGFKDNSLGAGATVPNISFLNGVMDEVAVFGRVLSHAEILQLYQDGLAGVGGPTRISAQEHAVGETWDLFATEFLSGGTLGAANYIDSATIALAATTTPGITTPVGTQSTNVTINYSCADTTSVLRDFLVEYSTNGGSSYANATLVSTSSGSVAGSMLSMVACSSGTSSNSFVWNSAADVLVDSSIVQIRITAQYPSGPSATTTNFTVDALTNLCTAGGEAAGGLTASELSFDNTAVLISGCTFSIDGAHSFSHVTIGNGSGSVDSILTHSETTTSAVFGVNVTVGGDMIIHSDGQINVNGRGFLGGQSSGNNATIGRTSGNTLTNSSTNHAGGSYGGSGGSGATGSVGLQYGDLANPTEAGGGGGGNGGGNIGGDGGGYVRLVVTGTLSLGGSINANGAAGAGGSGGGAGGGIFVSAATIAGSAAITANGGDSGSTSGGGAGGRIAIYYTNFTHSGTRSAYGGTGTSNHGGAGTIFLKGAAQTYGDVIVNNNLATATPSTLTPSQIYQSTSTALTATELTDSTASFLPGALVGLSLNPDVTQHETFVVTANTATMITVTGDMTTVAAMGNIYAIARPQFDALTLSGSSFVAIDNFSLTVTALTLTDTAILTHAETTLSETGQLVLTATNATIGSTASINVNGRGFVGGRSSGNASDSARTSGNAATNASTDHAGGSYGGLGGSGASGTVGLQYGDLTNPVEPGAGGGGNDSPANTGGDGGGLVRLTVSGTLTVSGSITANGTAGTGGSGGGSGGGVYLNVGTLAGTGAITANGGNSGSTAGGGAGGRLALYYTSITHSGTRSVYGGTGTSIHGGAGTIFLKTSGQAYGDILINNNLTTSEFSSMSPHQIHERLSTGLSATVLTDSAASFSPGTLIGLLVNPDTTQDQTFTITANTGTTVTVIGDMTTVATIGDTYAIARPQFDSLTLAGSSFVAMDNFPFSATTITFSDTSSLTHPQTSLTEVYELVVNATTMTVGSTATINANGRGFLGGRSGGNTSDSARTSGNLATNASTDHAGGSYGGRGGSGVTGTVGLAYGSLSSPMEPGSGGGGNDSGSNTGGDGGGLVRLTVTGTFTLTGALTANGSSAVGGAGGGSGGGIYISAGTLTGSGDILANGGSSGSTAGGGSGGRIAIFYNTLTHNGNRRVFGGIGTPEYGASGTIFIKDNAVSDGDLLLNNNSVTTTAATPLFVTGQPSTYTFRNLSVLNLATLLIDTPCAGTPALTITGVTDLSGSGVITNNQPGTCTLSQGAIAIVTAILPTATVNVAYSQAISSTGGYGPHTFVCRSGGVTVACTTVLPTGLTMSSAGIVSGTPTVTGTTLFTVRATESSPGVAIDEETLSITVGTAPGAPTLLFAHSTDAQSCCSSPTTDTTPVFSAVFNDADTGNTAGKYRIQVASDAGFTTVLWDSGSAGTVMGGSCAIGARCANITYGGSALSAGGVTYHWRIKYWDNSNLEGVFSAGSTFSTSTAPTAPTTLFSNDSNAQSGLTNPIGILATHPVFSAVFNDPDLGDTANKYRVQVSTTNNFSGIVWDSGSGGTNMTTCTVSTRCSDIVFGGTSLARDESVYYWRIKYWDVAGVEGAWSQDPTSTNTFTMGTGGGSVQVIQQQQQSPQPTVPDAPIAGAVEVLGPTSVRYNWIDVSSNETGFRVLNAQNQVIADVTAGQTSAVEQWLPANTLVDGRKVLAYNSLGQSSAVPFASVRTAAPTVQPMVGQRGGDSVTFIIEPAFTIQSGETTAFPGQTAVRIDLIITDAQGITRTMTSDWVQSNEYTFTGITPSDEIQVRVVSRNEAGLQNEPTEYVEIGSLSRRFNVSLAVFKKGTETLPRPMVATDVISVRMTLTSVGTDAANSVTLNLPLPRYIKYVPGSLMVDGRNGTDTADQGGTLANQNGVAASWATVNPGESHTVAFELVFDLEDLGALRETSVVGTPDEVLAVLVQAAANPLINLQASVSFAESDAVYMSPVITLEPDVETAVEPVIEETPVEEVPVEEQPVQLPTPEETQIIEQILQQEFPAPTPTPQPGEPVPGPAPVSTLQIGETVSDSDAGSFNLNVTGSEAKLGLTGNASVQADQIQFTGTTTEPFTVITLIFNDSITAIAVSDANGFWQTFVDADRLGILPGQEATVKIEAIAAKGDLRSERVSVGDVVVSRGRTGDIAAEFDTTVSDSPIISVLEEIEHQVVQVVEEQEPVIKATLTVSAPVVIVSSAPLWGYLPYAPALVYHFISWLIGTVGRKKKDEDHATYGVVYDAITKSPLALAIVRIYNNADNKLASTIVTDKLGRYDALLAPGSYRLEVSKPQYQYPSGIVTSSVDGQFDRIYNKQTGFSVTEHSTVVPHVPVDPVNAQRQWQLSFGFKKLWLAFQRAGNLLATPIIVVGLVMSLALLYAVPAKPSNWIIAGLYALTLAIQFKLKPKLIKAWGVVYDVASNAILPLVTIQLIEPTTSKVVTSRLSDYEGRFTFLPEPGSYVVKASKPGFTQVTEVVQSPFTDRQPLPQTIEIKKPSERVSGDVAMKQGN